MAPKKGFKHSEEAKTKISLAGLGRLCSEETKQKISKANKGRIRTEEHKQKISKANKGRIPTDEMRLKMSKIHKGKIVSETTRVRMSEAAKLKWQNPEYQKQISQINKLWERTPEMKLKMSKAHKGKTLNEAHRKKIGKSVALTLQDPKIRKKMGKKGSSNPNWKGGITPETIKLRNAERYKKWREKVFKRDNYTCRICGERGGKLNAHHCKSFAKYPELRYRVKNGITLCADCHRLTDTYLKCRKKRIEPEFEQLILEEASE